MEYVQVERDKYFKRKSEFIQEQIQLMNVAENAKAKIDDKWIVNPYNLGNKKRFEEKNFI